MKPECITRMFNVLESDPEVALVCCKRDILTHLDNRFTQGWISSFEDLQRNLKLDNTNLSILPGKTLLESPDFRKKPINIIGEPVAVMFRRDLIASIGYFDTAMFQLVDFEYWLRMFKDHKIAFIPEHLAQFRLHGAQSSFLNDKTKINDEEDYYKLLYNRYFWSLHINFKWFLIKRYHFIFKWYRLIKSYLRLNKIS